MENKLKLVSSDKRTFEVEEWVVQEWQTLRNMIEVIGREFLSDPIPLPNVSSQVLTKVIEYSTYHADFQTGPGWMATIFTDELKSWDADFKVDYAMLASLVKAADYLNIASLLDLATDAVSDRFIS